MLEPSEALTETVSTVWRTPLGTGLAIPIKHVYFKPSPTRWYLGQSPWNHVTKVFSSCSDSWGLKSRGWGVTEEVAPIWNVGCKSNSHLRWTHNFSDLAGHIPTSQMTIVLKWHPQLYFNLIKWYFSGEIQGGYHRTKIKIIRGMIVKIGGHCCSLGRIKFRRKFFQ